MSTSSSTRMKPLKPLMSTTSIATILDELAQRVHAVGADNYKQIDFSINEERWDAVRRRLGIPPDQTMEALGSGGFGTVYAIGVDKALKLTRDDIEAYAAEKIRKNPIPEAYHVYDVFRIDRVGAFATFGILMERLEPLAYYDEWRVAILNYSTQAVGLTPAWVEEFAAYVDSPKFTGEPLPDGFLDWLRSAAKSFAKLGIVPRDVHGKNIMRRPSTGEHVIIDIGAASKAPKQGLPRASVLESSAAVEKVGTTGPADPADATADSFIEGASTFSWYDIQDHLEKVSPGLVNHIGLMRWLSGFRNWKLIRLSENQINDETLYSDRRDWKEIVDRYALMDPKTMPPIVVAPDEEGHDGKWHIIDGRHRALARFKNGKKVLAYAPVGIHKKSQAKEKVARPPKLKKESPQMELPLASVLDSLALDTGGQDMGWRAQETDAALFTDEALKQLGLQVRVHDAPGQVNVSVKEEGNRFSAGSIAVRKVAINKLEKEVQIGLAGFQDGDSEDPIWVVFASELEYRYQNKGIGRFLYEKAIDLLRVRYNDSFWFLPHNTIEDGGDTSSQAGNVWKALAKIPGYHLVTFDHLMGLWIDSNQTARQTTQIEALLGRAADAISKTGGSS